MCQAVRTNGGIRFTAGQNLPCITDPTVIGPSLLTGLRTLGAPPLIEDIISSVRITNGRLANGCELTSFLTGLLSTVSSEFILYDLEMVVFFQV